MPLALICLRGSLLTRRDELPKAFGSPRPGRAPRTLTACVAIWALSPLTRPAGAVARAQGLGHGGQGVGDIAAARVLRRRACRRSR